jgi:hypothetical protein
MRSTQKSPVHTPQQADHPIMRKLDPSDNDQILERLFAVRSLLQSLLDLK